MRRQEVRKLLDELQIRLISTDPVVIKMMVIVRRSKFTKHNSVKLDRLSEVLMFKGHVHF